MRKRRERHWGDAMRVFVVWLTSAALLALSAVNILILVAQAPALNPLMRDTALIDDWREGALPTLFERGAYYRSRALTHLNLVEGGEDVDLLDQASELARLAVQNSPSDAFGWTLLSWAEMLRGEDDAAQEALSRSWALAPHSTALASDRLILAEALGLVAPVEPLPDVQVALTRDAQRLQEANPAFFDQLRENHPDIDAMMEAEEFDYVDSL